MPHPSPEQSGLPQVGDLLAGKYRIEKLLGMGGMGTVYGANHELLSQKVAIKVLLAEIAANQEAVARFLNEARASAKIQNEHCARVMDVGTLEGGQAFMVMEYLEGCDLGQLLERNGPLPTVAAVDYLLQSLEALAHAHALHLVHRDLKPANLFLARQQDGTDIVKVLDFGISKATNGPGGTNPSLTSTKALLGSPLYMSPEQLRSSKNVDPRTDIWALGIILYELLTGRTPYDGDNVGELFAAILEKDAPSVRVLRPDVPPGLDEAILCCLRRDPNQRFADVGQLAEAIAPFASPYGASSVDRVRRSIATLRGGGVSPPPGQAPRASAPGFSASGNVLTSSQSAAQGPGHQTAAAWGNTGGVPVKKGMGAGPLIGVAVVLGLVGFGGVAFVMHKGPEAASTTAAAALPPPAIPETTPAAPPPTGAPANVAPAPSASAAPATSVVATPQGTPGVRPGSTGRPAAPTTPATAKPATAAHPTSPATAAPTAYDPTKDTSAQ